MANSVDGGSFDEQSSDASRRSELKEITLNEWDVWMLITGNQKLQEQKSQREKIHTCDHDESCKQTEALDSSLI